MPEVGRVAARTTRVGRLLACAAAFCFLSLGSANGQWFNGTAFSELGSLSGEIVPGEGQCFWVRDLWGTRHVAELVAEVDKRYVVKSPDGALQVIRFSEAQPTALRYAPMDERALRDHLVKGEYRKGGWKGAVDGQHVYVYKCSEEFLVQAQKVISKMYVGTKDYFVQRKFDVKLHVDPMVVVIFGTYEEFRADHGRGDDILGFYDPYRNRITLYEKPEEGAAAPKMAQRQVLLTAAHEVVHQTLFNIGVQPRLGRWPFWMTEGMAEYLEPSMDRRTLEFAGVGRTNDADLRILKGLAGTPKLQLLARDLVGEKPDTTGVGYSAAWAYVHYLAQRRNKEFRAYLRTLMQRKPLEQVVKPAAGTSYPTELSVFVQHFGKPPKDFYNDVIEHVGTLKYRDPSQDDAHLVVAVEFVRGGRVARDCLITVDPEQVDLAKEMLLKRMPASERSAAQFRVKEFDDQKAAFRYAGGWNSGGGAIVLE